MTAYQQGIMDKLAEMSDLFGFGKKKDTPTGEITGGIAGGVIGAGAGKALMRRSPAAANEVMRILRGKTGIPGKLLKAYGKRIIPLALVGAAIGAITGGRIQEEM